jgi:hypothetical protein
MVVSVDGQEFGYGTTVSPVVRAAVPRVIDRVRDALANGIATSGAPAPAGSCRRSMGR